MSKLKSTDILKQSWLIILFWTLAKVINIIQIDIWLKSVNIDRSIFQVIQAQGLIWLVGFGAILTINFFIRRYSWFTTWGLKTILLNIVVMIFFGVLVPVGPSVVYILWSSMQFNFTSFTEIYQNGTADILKDVSLYYILILSLSYGMHFYNVKTYTELKSARLREDLTKAKLDLLHSQLQPHFLFNTLHSISSLMEENVKDAQNILVNLSDLLRISLEVQDTKFITLKEELDVLNLYLSIQMTRFSDSLEVLKEIDDAINVEMVPAFILQPLVENSFKHGMQDKLKLIIRAKKTNSWIEIVIQDNGSGFNELKEGVGISNVRTRLSALYEEFELVITSENGVKNELRLPILHK